MMLTSSNRTKFYSSNSVVPSKEWRRGIPLISKRRHERTADSVTVNISDQMKWTTCVEALPKSKYVLVGSGARQNNFFVIENTASNKLVEKPDYIPPADSMVIRSAFTLPNPIFHLSVANGFMATGGPEGCIQVYQIDSSLLGQKGKGLSHANEIPLGETSLSQLRISPPGVSIGTVRVNHVEFVPTGKNATPERIIATQGRKLYIADISTGQIVGQEILGVDTVYRASCSPHPSSSGHLICTGGNDKLLSILDSRLLGKSAGHNALKFPNAHRATITDTKFNQFIPYWVASAGEDGVVKIWDIRFMGGPAAKIDGHYGAITSLCWSTTHCDMISTGSTDRFWKAWSLNSSTLTSKETPKEFFVGCPGSEWRDNQPTSFDSSDAVFGARLLAEYQSDMAGPIVSISASTSHADAFYTVSGLGEVTCHTIRADVYEEITDHRFKDSSSRDVEIAVQSRDLSTAFSRVIQISRNQRKDGFLLADNENELIHLCTIRPPMKPDSWKMSNVNLTINEEQTLLMKAAFKKDLEEYSYCIPPRFGEFEEWTKEIPSVLRLEYDLVILRAKIVYDIINKNWKNIQKIEDTICECMELSNQFLESVTLTALMELMLINNFTKGLSMASRLIRILQDDPKLNMNDYADFVACLAFPTMFEGSNWLLQAPMNEQQTIRKTITIRQELIIKMQKDQEERQLSPMLPTPEAVDKSPVSTSAASPARASFIFDRPGSRKAKSVTAAIPTDRFVNPERTMHLQEKVAKTAAVVNALPSLRSIPSMIALELKLFKLLEEVQVCEWRDLDLEVIETLQKWDFNIGGQSRKAGSTNPSNSGFGQMVTPYEKTLSFFTNRIYLEALLRKQKLEDFFGTAMDLCCTFSGHDSSKIILRHVENEGLTVYKSLNDTKLSQSTMMIGEAANEMKSNNITSKSIDQLASAIKILRDPINSLVRVTALMMKVGETKPRPEIAQVSVKCFTSLSSQFLLFTTNITRAFEMLEKTNRKDVLKEVAQSTHDQLREAIRLLPLSSDKRPLAQAEKVITGYSVHEEAFSVVDKLYRLYLKPATTTTSAAAAASTGASGSGGDV